MNVLYKELGVYFNKAYDVWFMARLNILGASTLNLPHTHKYFVENIKMNIHASIYCVKCEFFGNNFKTKISWSISHKTSNFLRQKIHYSEK